MDKAHIESAARTLEKNAEFGDADAMQKQLNNMKPADQLAVIKEMKHINDQKREKQSDLPSVEITMGTNEKGKDAVTGISVHSDYSNRTTALGLDVNSGKVVSEDVNSTMGSKHVALEYDEKGKVAGRTVEEKSSMSSSTYVYDAKGRQVSRDVEMSGTHFQNTYDYDDKTGKLLHSVGIMTMPGGQPSKNETVYDPKTGKATSVELTVGNTPTTHFDIDPKTGQTTIAGLK